MSARFLRLAQAPGPGGHAHLTDARRPERTLCGRGLFLKGGWRVASLTSKGSITCVVCQRIASRRYLGRRLR